MSHSSAMPYGKTHFQVLDGLRGVAALIVVAFHIFEVYSSGDHTRQILNHGYLAVDFFFLLSGFVVTYAYDDRWSRMTTWDFFKRRLIRLQPMLVMGNLLGAALFYLQTGPAFPMIADTPVRTVLLFMLIGFTLLPVPPSLDIRGWQEMHPLDGPAWSLFFEYLANILYALILRRLSNRILALLVLFSAAFLTHLLFTSPQGDVIGGWSLTAEQLHIGFARLLYPFLAGMLLMRAGKRISVPGAFFFSSLLLTAILCLPRLGGHAHLWQNALYESVCVLIVFPVIVAMGAGGPARPGFQSKVCSFLGDLSYPLYVTHYPLIYVYTAWVVRQKASPRQGILPGMLLYVMAVAIAYVCLRLYDEPVRDWLSRRWIVARKKMA